MTKFTLIPTISEEAFEDMERRANISTEFFGLFKKKPKEKPIDYKVESAIEDKIEEDFEYIDNINKICQVLEKEGLLKKDTSQQNKVKELKKQYPYLPNDYVYFVSNYGFSAIKNIDTYGTDIKLLDHFPKLSEKEELVDYVEDFNCQAYFKESIKDITAKEGEVVVIGEYTDPDNFRYLGISKKGMFDISFDHRARIGWLSNDNFADYFEELSITYLLNSSLFYTQFAKLAELYKKGQLDISVEDIQPDSENIPTQEIVEASTKTDTDVTDNPIESSTETKESTTTEDPVDEYVNDEIETSLIVLDVDSQTGNASDNSTEETPTDSSATSDSDSLDDTVQDSADMSDQATEEPASDDSTSDSVDNAESGESAEPDASTDDTQNGSTETGEGNTDTDSDSRSAGSPDDNHSTENSTDSSELTNEKEPEAEPTSDNGSDKESELEEEKENFTADDLTNDKEEAKQVEEENPELDKKVENDTDEDATNTTTDSTDDTSDTSEGEDIEESSSEPTDTTTDDKPASTQSETTEIEETEETTTETELNPAQEALYDLLEMRHALVHSSLSTEDYRAIRKHLGYVTLNYLREEAPKLKLLSMEEMTSPQKDLLHSVHTAIESLREKYQLSQVQYSFEDATTMTNEDITLSMEKITLGTFGKAFKNVFFNSGEPAYNSLAAINGIFFRAFGKAYWADPDKLKNRGAIEKKVNEILDQIDRDSEIHWAMIEKNIISTPQYIPISTKEEWDAIRSKVNTVKDKWKKKYDKKTLKAIKEKDSKKYKDLIRRSGAMSSILDVCRKLPKLKKK
nr:MAG TPA: MSCRAMM family adhesin SdrC [Caudoviricetes sp.]